MSGSFHREVWLAQAKRLPVGTTVRVPHPGDRTARANLIIGHDAGKYWCYCQSCKRGAVDEKSHVMVTGAQAPAMSADLSLPTDMVRIHELDDFSRSAVLAFLVSKNVDPMFLPELFFSEGRRRLLLDTGLGWLGRDTTEASHQKWLTYHHTQFLSAGPVKAEATAVFVEDPFSYYKVAWALRGMADQFQVYCALGTRVRPALALEIAQHSRALAFMDGDKAGASGAAAARTQFKAYGVRCTPACAPAGKDPKDMTAQEIRDHVAIAAGT